MISSSVYAGIPARYVMGYFLPEDTDTEATHAWVEIYFKNVGWIAFDPSNNSSTNERYLRICSGFDSISAAPIKGVAIGSSDEELDVNILDKFIFSENGYERTGDDWNLIYQLGV